MELKYVRHEYVGFVLWPKTQLLWHSHIGNLLEDRTSGKILSAGFVNFVNGLPICSGYSESLGVDSKDGDSEALAKQLGLIECD